MLPLSNQKQTIATIMSVTIREKVNQDFSISLYLDIYSNGRRWKEYLKECKLVKVTNPTDRTANTNRKRMAKEIAVKRASELQANEYDISASFKTNTDILEFFQNYIDSYQKRDKRNVSGVFNLFKEYLKEKGITNLSAKHLDENLVFKFSEYLKQHCTGEGASSYFARFKKVLKQAVRERILLINPANEITIKRDESIKKDVLTIDEIQAMAKSPIQNQQIRNAFLFSCVTGLRWVDVKELQWKHIDTTNLVLSKIQAKTGIKVKVNLGENAINFLPERLNPDEFVFDLPSHSGASKSLRQWAKRAGIVKHITWHCARHSFATNLILHKNDVLTVSELMGHASLKYTQRYTRIADEMKRDAVNSLPRINNE